VSKNGPNNLKVGCKSPSNLVELIEIDANLKKKLKKFEKAFEKDEHMNI
jgi:hypothetical protein